jgi:hypothetical protein
LRTASLSAIGARHYGVGHVVIVEMGQDALEVVDLEGAADAERFSARSHHEVLD